MVDNSHAAVYLRPGKEKPVRAHHPWVFSGAIDRVVGAGDGDTVEILAADGEWLARGYYNSRSQITVRVWTWERAEPVDAALFLRRIRTARDVRRRLGLQFGDAGPTGTDAFRLINGESDLLPGLVADIYGNWIVVQFLTLGAERWKNTILDGLEEVFHPRAICERSDAETRSKEGLVAVVGTARGRAPDAPVPIRENGQVLAVDLLQGQKTGSYLDQRWNRQLVSGFVGNRTGESLAMLDAFAYTGGFGLACCAANPGVRVCSLDESEPATVQARRNYENNGFLDRVEFITANAFRQLRAFRDADRHFDIIVLDPPKFAASQGRVAGACRGYKDLNLLALKLLSPGGLLATFSCSGLVTPELFRKVLFGAAQDAGRLVRILAVTGHAPDHPVLLSFPEGEYLKGLVLQVA